MAALNHHDSGNDDASPPVGHPDPGPLDTSRAHPARRYAYWIGGKDHFAADRASAEAIAAIYPHIRTSAIENRRFLHRAVHMLTTHAGVRQFLDIGAGLPAAPNVHDIAHAHTPTSRTVYVDNDPMVIAHTAGLTTRRHAGTTAYLLADLRQPDTILTAPAVRDTLDFTQPIGLLLTAVLHFLPDTDAYPATAQLLHALPPGSHLVISHATDDLHPPQLADQLHELTATGRHGFFQPRTRHQINGFLHGLNLIEPGLVPTVHWQPHRPTHPQAAARQAAAYAAIGYKP